MTISVNGAGVSQANPILAGIGVKLAAGASSMDVAEVVDAWIDAASGFPGTTSVKADLSPAATTLLAGASGSYNDTSKQITLSTTTGLSAGDPLYLSHASISAGLYVIDTVVDGTKVTLRGNPFNGLGDLTNMAYQVAWGFNGVAGTAPIATSGAGSRNWFKARMEDAANIQSQLEHDFWVANAPSGADYIELEGGSYTGQTVADAALTLNILRNWTNAGGVSHVALANHSGQSVNNFTWTSGGGSGEVALSTAEAGLTIGGGDGLKYGRLLMRSYQGGLAVGVDFSAALDTTGPTLVMQAFGR